MRAVDRLREEVQRGESGLALLILLGAIFVAVATIVTIALIVVLAAYYAS
jgi:hypothetical protein